MKTITKKVISLVAAVVLALGVMTALTGCGTVKKIDKDGNITLQYWSIYPEGDANYQWQLDKIAAFCAANPKVKIEYTGISFWDYFAKITTSQTDPKGPDIYLQTITDNGYRSKGGVSMNLKPYFDDNLNESIYNEMDLTAMTYSDGVYGVPYSVDGRLLYYNIDMVNALKTTTDAQWTATKAGKKENTTITGKPADLVGDDGNVRAPKTYDELMAYSELLTKRNAQDKIEQLGFDVNIGNNSITNFVWTQGGSFFDESGNPIVNTDAGVRKGFETWYEIARVQPIADVNGFVDSGSGGTTSSENLFWSKKVALMIATNEIPWKNDKLAAADRINIGAAPIPYVGSNRYNFSGGFSLEVSRRLEKEDPRVVEAAVNFVKFMMSEDVQKEVLTETSNMPGNVKVYDELAADITDPAKLAVLEEMNYRRPFDFIEKASSWWTPVVDNLTKYVSGKSELDKALGDAQSGILKQIATA